MSDKNIISTSDYTIFKLKVLAKEKEDVRLKLVTTAEELKDKAEALAVAAEEKEDVRKKLEVTAEELKDKATKLATTAEENEDIKRKLAVTAEELKDKAEALVVTAKEKEDVRKKLAVTAEELRLKAEALVDTAKEKEDVRKKLAVTAEELRNSRKTLERKVLERTKDLAYAKARDEAILESIGDGLVAVDKEGKILIVSKAVEQILGWKAEEIVGKSFVEIVPLEDETGKAIPRQERLLTKMLISSSSSSSSSWYYIRKDKTRFPVAITVAPFILEGKIVGAVEVFRDFTKEKEVDKVKTEFVSLASHQLRTPLSIISWYAEMLLAGDAGKLNDNQKKYLEELYRGNHRMIDLMNSLLNVSRMELGTFSVEPKPTDVVRIANDAVEEQQPGIKGHKLVLKVNYALGLPKINTDPKLLYMVFQNLLSNAVKYTQEKGRIEFSIKKENDQILISIADTGLGIPKEQQDKIFTKLFRADNVREKDAEGTGLGLYIVKSIIEHSGGKIWFESEENKGTTFYVELPLDGIKRKVGNK